MVSSLALALLSLVSHAQNDVQLLSSFGRLQARHGDHPPGPEAGGIGRRGVQQSPAHSLLSFFPSHMSCQGGQMPPVSKIVILARSLLSTRILELYLVRGSAPRNEHAPDPGCGIDVDTRALGRAASFSDLTTGPFETQHEPDLTHNRLIPTVKGRLQLLHSRSCHANPPSYFPPQDGEAAKGMVILSQSHRSCKFNSGVTQDLIRVILECC